MNIENTQTGHERFKRAIIILAVIGAVITATSLIIATIVLTVTKEAVYALLIITHYPVTMGLPFAGIGALALVVLLEYARGPIEFEIPGFKFKGAAGPLVLWVFVYLAITTSVVVLWDSKMSSNMIDHLFKERIKTAILEERYERCQMEKDYQNYSQTNIDLLCANEIRTWLENESED